MTRRILEHHRAVDPADASHELVEVSKILSQHVARGYTVSAREAPRPRPDALVGRDLARRETERTPVCEARVFGNADSVCLLAFVLPRSAQNGWELRHFVDGVRSLGSLVFAVLWQIFFAAVTPELHALTKTREGGLLLGAARVAGLV